MFRDKKMLYEIKELNNMLKEYIEKKESKKRVFIDNFLSGIAKGLGISVGIIILGTVIILILRELVTLPVIGQYIAEIVNIVDYYMK